MWSFPGHEIICPKGDSESPQSYETETAYNVSVT